MRAHEPAMPAAAADSIELSQDMAAELRDYLEWLLRRKSGKPHSHGEAQPQAAKPGHDAVKRDGGESS